MRRWLPALILLLPLLALLPFVLVMPSGPKPTKMSFEMEPISNPATWESIYETARAAYDAGDYKNAIARVLPIAVDGHPPAQRLFGQMLEQGAGMPADFCYALVWMDKAARAGDAEAQFELGFSYFGGNPIGENIRLSYYWVMTAVRNGYQEADIMLDMFDTIRRDERLLHLVGQLDDRMVDRVSPKTCLRLTFTHFRPSPISLNRFGTI